MTPLDPAALARKAVNGCTHLGRGVDGPYGGPVFGACAPCLEAAIRAALRLALTVPGEEAGRLFYELSAGPKAAWADVHPTLQRSWSDSGLGFLAALRTRAGLMQTEKETP